MIFTLQPTRQQNQHFYTFTYLLRRSAKPTKTSLKALDTSILPKFATYSMPPLRPNPGRYYSKHRLKDTSCTVETMLRQADKADIPIEDFARYYLHSIKLFPEPILTDSDLDWFNVTRVHLDFKTGRDESQKRLLVLQKNTMTDRSLHRLKHWASRHGGIPKDLLHRYRDGEIEPEDEWTETYRADSEAYDLRSRRLSSLIDSYLCDSSDGSGYESVQRETAWRWLP